MERHEIVKDGKGNFVRYEHWKNGKKETEMKESKNELPAEADWNEIEKGRKWKEKGEKGKPPWAKGKGKGKKKGKK